MILKELLKPQIGVATVKVGNTIAETANIMREKHIGCVVVIDEQDHVMGIVTDRDIAMALALEECSPDSFVNEVMTFGVDTVTETMTVHDVTRFMRTVDVKRLPVVNEENRLVGIVSIDDLIALLSRELFDTCSSLTPKLGHAI